MRINHYNIALVSDNAERLLNFKMFLASQKRRIFTLKFDTALQNGITSETYDLIIFDSYSNANFNIKPALEIRNSRFHYTTPIIFIFSESQQNSQMDVYKDEFSTYLTDPVDKITFLNTVQVMENLGRLEKRYELYKEILDGEKQIVHHLDQLLQIQSFAKISEESMFFQELKKNFTNRLELTFAVEKAFYFETLSDKNKLQLQIFYPDSLKVKQNFVFDISTSKIRHALETDSPQIFEEQLLIDPFIQELEESLGFEITSLLFMPVSVFHETKGGFGLVNKVYRHSFSENDISLILMTTNKIIFHLEKLILKESNLNNVYELLNSQKDSAFDEFFNQIMRDIQFGILVFDMQGKIKFINEYSKNILKISSEPAAIEEILGIESANSITSIIKNSKLPALRKELTVQLTGKTAIDLGFSIYKMRERGGEKQYMLTFMEITHTKRFQTEIVRMDRMASLGVLASGIAHEIRNPLAGIKAIAQTLEEELKSEPHKTEYVERIIRQVNRLDKLLKSFFSYARPQRPNPAKCEIGTIINEVLPLFKRKIEEKKVNVQVEYAPDLKPVFVDAHQIQQVIFNLLINAIDAIGEDGTVAIKARLAREAKPILDRRQQSPKVFSDVFNEIEISDTGAGMSEEILKNIFDPFFTTKNYGTGLGLSIVYQIVREHGGQIFVESVENKGTTFQILLPVFIEKVIRA